MSRPGRHKLLVDGLIVGLLFWIAPRPGTRAPDADLVARESRSARGGPSLAESLFASATELDQSLRGQPTESRTASEYRHAIDAYAMVVRTGIDPDLSAESLAHAADLMREMADGSGDYALYRQAIEAYRKVISEYSQSNLVAYSLLSIAQINEENLQDLDGAAAAYSEIVRHFPKSVMGREAHAVLDRFDDELRARDPAPDVVLTAATATGDTATRARLNNVRNFNGPDYARVVLDLSDGTQYADRRIESNRIGIQLTGAAVDPTLQGRRFITSRSGLLKRIRVTDGAQPVKGQQFKSRSNTGQSGVSIGPGVSIEIEANGLYGYSAFRLSNPERIIIDLHSAKYAAEAPAWRPASGEASRPPQPGGAMLSGSAEAARKSGGQPVDADRARLVGPASAPAVTGATTMDAGRAASVHALPDSAARVEASGGVRIQRDDKLPGSVKCIVIDPGHGGHDTGTIGSGGLREKDLVLDVARRLKEYIARNYPDIEVLLTRDSDRFIALEERTAIANSRRADLFISIHANSSPSRVASGVETFIQDPNRTPLAAKAKHEAAPAGRAEASSLAASHLAPASLAVRPDDALRDKARTAAAGAAADHTALDARPASAETPKTPEPMVAPMVTVVSAGNRFGASRELAGFIQSSLVRGIGATSPRTAADRGVKHAAFAVLLGAAMPSVLAEVSFVSNRRDENLLQTGAFRDRIAASLFSGLSAYLKKNRPSPGAAKK
jgi:N-acetylmuramoyl-L-alanine amidase